MALGDSSNPTRFLQGQHATDDRALALEVYGGEVLAAYDEAVIMADKHQVKTVAGGMRSEKFPLTWEAEGEYHAAGQEMLGNEFETSEREITIDGLLVSHYAIYDVDAKLSHFDIGGEITRKMGVKLAQIYDKNVLRATIQASRVDPHGVFPGGGLINSATLAAVSGAYDGYSWLKQIEAANEIFYEKNVPETMPRYLTVPLKVFNAIRYAKDPDSKQYVLLDRNLGNGNAAPGSRLRQIDVDGVTVIAAPPTVLPTTDEKAATKVWSKYRANYTGVLGVMWTPMAVGTLKVMDIGMETERDVRRQEDFMVAKMLAGHGTLRPECAIEFRASARPA
jgi:hypothetical protein